MPGSRLSHEDRRRIASGMAEGLGYAEVARRIDRPTSTVSREVTRNGGPAGYRADYAHHATVRRARRRRQIVAAQPAAEVAYGRDPEVVRAFEEQFAAVIVDTGLPRMVARLTACLYVTDSGSLTAAELADRLRVSPASISKAVAYLESQDLIRRERGPRRRERYCIDDDVWARAWTSSARMNDNWADVARRGADALGAETPAGVRVREMGEFFTQLVQDMTGGISVADTGDALTVLAALVEVAEPLGVAELANALGWSAARVEAALRDLAEAPKIADPLAVRRTESGSYTAVTRFDRLTTAQREGLVRRGVSAGSRTSGPRRSAGRGAAGGRS
jgi:DNA-binding transcriptional regulator GbsR (MarR family)